MIFKRVTTADSPIPKTPAFSEEQTFISEHAHDFSTFSQNYTEKGYQTSQYGDPKMLRPALARDNISNLDVEDHEEYRDEMVEGLEIEEPETVIGEGVCLKGELSFKRYLCINGEFEGDLKSSGKVKVGRTGIVRSNLQLHSAIIEGKVIGDILIEDLLELRGSAQVFGNIRARYLRVDDGVTLNGHVQIMPEGLKQPSESTLFEGE